MSSDERAFQDYAKDSRIPCQYGLKCYQKNQAHHAKYKHPPGKDQKKKNGPGIRRKRKEPDHVSTTATGSISPRSDSDFESRDSKRIRLSPSNSPETTKRSVDETVIEDSATTSVAESGNEDPPIASTNSHEDADAPSSGLIDEDSSLPADVRVFVKEKFLVAMPDEFYAFHEFCREVSPNAPSDALKIANMTLVGPFDLLSERLRDFIEKSNEDFWRHWRYYYDPPEFQTVVKIDNKEGSHLGYWRDSPSEEPIFVARNDAAMSCKISPLAANLFGAVDILLEAKLKIAGPFEKPKLANVRLKLKKFAKDRSISLEKSTEKTRAREKRVVARTFHGAGIVVPYDKKTQLGYRELSETDANLKKIIKKLDEAEDDEARTRYLTELEEVVRWATIAADECDFGTCLELGHDLFSSGSPRVLAIALQTLTTAYTLLDRPEFIEIARAHSKSRKQDFDLSIV